VDESTGRSGAEPQRVWMNPQDARARGIGADELVEVFNRSGTIAIPAKITERIMPGVVAINQGAWYRPGKGQVDTGGCANSLTSHRVSPTGGMAVHSERVQIRRRVS
jgi:anaerobic dimethyl sulfoxide reductase subunit A